MKSAVAYYRVSTQRQGRSGLGLEAQRTAVTRFAQAEGITLLAEFTEVETGMVIPRPNGGGIQARRRAGMPVLRDIGLPSGLRLHCYQGLISPRT